VNVGIPKEIKVHEYRVAIVPAGVRELVGKGHAVRIEAGAGVGSGISDATFQQAGAQITTVDEVWQKSDLIMKVKEPIPAEYKRIRAKQTLFTYFHLAAVPELAPVLLEQKVTAIAYETIQLPSGRLPLLQPMSEVAGKMSVQIGANLLEKERGGKGVLLGGIPGVRRGRVAILGGGTVGTAAAKIAVGLGASVTILDKSLPRLEYLDDIFGSRVNLLYSNPDTVTEEVRRADLVIGAVLVPGARAPKIVSKQLIANMEEGSVVVDVAIDQGGCIETIHPTTHEAPTYVVSGVLHYAVTNMPGAVAHTSAFALTNATLPYAIKLAELGALEAARRDPALALGINAHDGRITHEAVAEALGMEYRPLPG
jgi:alanine dehydrogenase